VPPSLIKDVLYRPAFELDTSKAYNLSSLAEICTFGFRGEGNVYVSCSRHVL
jgi:hypothetical protein